MTMNSSRDFNELIKELKVSHAGFYYHERRPRAAGKMAISATLFRSEDEGRACWVFQDVHPGGAAFKAGIQPGDVLLRVQDEEVRPRKASVVSAWGSNACGHLPPRWFSCSPDS